MTVEFWIGNDFERTAERNAFFQFLALMEDKLGSRPETYFVCANYFLAGKQIDITVIKETAVIVIEIKERNLPFRATENGDWLSIPDNLIFDTPGENPYEQVLKYRRLWMTHLEENQAKFLPTGKGSSLNFTHVSAIVAISPKIPDNTINDISARVKVWFQLVGLDDLPVAISNQTSQYLNFTNDEIYRLIRNVMHLRKGDKYLGLVASHLTGLRYGRIPPKPSILVGRQEALNELKIRLGIRNRNEKNNHSSTQVMTAMRGWPGVGKTTLAAALAHDQDIDKYFPDGLLWTSLGEKPDIIGELQRWIQCSGFNAGEDIESPEDLRSFLISYLDKKRMLIIIDDVWNLSDAEFFRVGGKNCATLFTTRIPKIAESLAPTSEDVYWLPVLDNKHSLELLKIIAPDIVNIYPKECEELCKDLEGLPLAIQVAGKLLIAENRHGKNIPEFLLELQQGAKLIKAQAPSDRSDLIQNSTPTVAALLKKSTDYLDSETEERFAFLGAFAPKPASFKLAAMKAVWQVDDPTPTVDTLLDLGLLENVDGDFQIHSLLVMLAKSLLS
jgi:hypothetical protein